MKYRWNQLMFIVLVVVLVIIGIILLPPDNAQASLGNQGIPVRCYVSGSIAPGTTVFLNCITPISPSFVGAQRVPDGYYFLVTDIFVTPVSGGAGNTPVGFYLYNAYGETSRESLYNFRSIDGASYGEHFTSPFYVLVADHRLEVQASNANATSFEIRVTGLLVTNVTYLSLISNP